MLSEIETGAARAMTELLDAAKLKAGDLVVVGCSSSEIMGGTIGKAGNPDAAAAVLRGILPALEERGLYLAAQCCEHLNRALIVEREVAEKYGYEIVSVRPRPTAGGSFAAAAYDAMRESVAVEYVKAGAGLDIGRTLIGMHLRPVAAPLRLSVKSLGHADVLGARTRPKLIGGNRAEYE